MELNREQIIKALECCTRGRKSKEERPCLDCPYNECNLVGGTSERQVKGTCQGWLMKDAISLIKQLTCENESLEAEKEHLEKVVEGKLKRTSALEKSVLVLTEDNHILATELKRIQEENERAHQSYYEIACEVEDSRAIAEQYQKQFEDCAEDRAKLTEENERLRAEGEWTYSEGKKTMKCTRCRLRMKTYDVRRFCPNCGAKMKGE